MQVDAGFDLTGRRAIVTGASAGIGAAIATRLANAGAHVVAVSRSGSAPPGAQRIQGVAADLSAEADLERVIADGVAVLYSSHLLGEVEPVADRIAILRNGAVTHDTTPDALKADVRAFRVASDTTDLPIAPADLLDDATHGRTRRVIARGAAVVEAALAEAGIDADPEELSLDDIFAALDTATAPAACTPEAA